MDDVRRGRIAVAYDCLFPYTVGGAERWYLALVQGLAEAGFEVTYLTRRQWDTTEPPTVPGVEIIAVSPPAQLYDRSGTRRLGPTVTYGLGVMKHLLRHRGRYQAIHTANFPFWSVLGARAATARTAVPLVVDWHEVWGRQFWQEYAGSVVGTVGFAVQRLCLLASTVPVVTSEVNAHRFVEEDGRSRRPAVLPGFMPSQTGPVQLEPTPAAIPGYVMFAGRHITDKGADLLPAVAVELARLGSPLRIVAVGDGPLRESLREQASALGVGDRLELPGFLEHDQVLQLMASASCVVVPSRREGYGMVVVEATMTGTPVVVAAFPENLAVGHVVDDVNGKVADPPSARSLAEAIVEVVGRGVELRQSTITRHRSIAAHGTIDHSVQDMVGLHRRLQAERCLRAPIGTS